MPTNDYIQPFFNIKGEFITNSYRKDDSLIYEVILPVTEHTCPCFGQTTKYIKDYRVRTINLGSIHGLYICAKYKQRRYSCPQCTHSFSEENPFIQRYKQLGMTTIAEIFRLLHEGPELHHHSPCLPCLRNYRHSILLPYFYFTTQRITDRLGHR